MITQTVFEHAIAQINQEFKSLKGQIERLEKKVADIETPPKPKIGRPRKEAA